MGVCVALQFSLMSSSDFHQNWKVSRSPVLTDMHINCQRLLNPMTCKFNTVFHLSNLFDRKNRTEEWEYEEIKTFWTTSTFIFQEPPCTQQPKHPSFSTHWLFTTVCLQPVVATASYSCLMCFALGEWTTEARPNISFCRRNRLYAFSKKELGDRRVTNGTNAF